MSTSSKIIAAAIVAEIVLIGTGLALAVLYLRPLDKDSPASTFGVAGFRTDSESWGAGVGLRTRFSGDRFRFNGGYAGYDLNYEFFGIDHDGHHSNRMQVRVTITS